jgi:acetolactate synthase small subunit
MYSRLAKIITVPYIIAVDVDRTTERIKWIVMATRWGRTKRKFGTLTNTLDANIVDVTRPVRSVQVRRVGVPISSEYKVRVVSRR